MGNALTRELSTTWSWFGVGTKTFMAGGPGVLPKATNVSDRSTDDACIVHVPGTGWLGSGHCVLTNGWVFQASGTKPKNWMSAAPSAGPHNSPGRPPLGHGIASLG